MGLIWEQAYMKKKEHIHLYNDYLLPTQRNFLVREDILKLKYHRSMRAMERQARGEYSEVVTGF